MTRTDGRRREDVHRCFYGFHEFDAPGGDGEEEDEEMTHTHNTKHVSSMDHDDNRYY